MLEFDPQTDIVRKEQRLLAVLDKYCLDAILLKRRDTFAWFSGGGNNGVVLSSEYGACILVITRQQTFLVAYTMDIERIHSEELHSACTIEPVALKWYEGGLEEKAIGLCQGRIGADFYLRDTEHILNELYELQYPLEEWELERLRHAGRVADEVFFEVAGYMKRDMLDYDLEAEIIYQCAKHGAVPEVLLIGVNERIEKHKHCIPAGERLGGTVLLHPAMNVNGMHANVARMVCFDAELPQQLKEKHEATRWIFAEAAVACKPGKSLTEILGVIRDGYEKRGLHADWEGHFKGGSCGYMLVDDALAGKKHVSDRHAFDWFITVTGAKTEELVLLSPALEIPSLTGLWEYEELALEGQSIKVPSIKMIQ